MTRRLRAFEELLEEGNCTDGFNAYADEPYVVSRKCVGVVGLTPTTQRCGVEIRWR